MFIIRQCCPFEEEEVPLGSFKSHPRPSAKAKRRGRERGREGEREKGRKEEGERERGGGSNHALTTQNYTNLTC